MKRLIGVMLAVLVCVGCGGGKDTKDLSPETGKTTGGNTDPALEARAAAERAAAEREGKARAKVDEVAAALADNKLDAAEAGLKELDAMKAELSADWQSRISNLSAQLQAIRNAPKLPELK